MEKETVFGIIAIALFALCTVSAGYYIYSVTISYEVSEYVLFLTSDTIDGIIPINTTIHFTATMMLDALPISGAQIELRLNGSTIATQTTNAEGKAFFTYTATTTGLYDFQARHWVP